MESPYDSRKDTVDHIDEVRRRLNVVLVRLDSRRRLHDASKLEEPEKSAFDEWTPNLEESTYGSEEYETFLAAMKPTLDHYYAHNSHHPEHYPEGIRGMCLLDVIEMLCDWAAASTRHDDGCIWRSIEINQKRFGYTDELKAILTNTAERLRFFGKTL